MKITTLVENSSLCGARTVHGLALYIESEGQRILFDVGPDDTLFENAELLGVNLREVDMVIISHGHYDHGGALRQFLEFNTSAKIYIQRSAFGDFRSHRPTGVAYIGLDVELKNHPRVQLLDGDSTIKIDETRELKLITVDVKSNQNRLYPSGNNTLYEGDRLDTWRHEQSLIIEEEDGQKVALLMGCAHSGVVNILNRAAPFSPQICIGGFHLSNPAAGKSEATNVMDALIRELTHYPQIKLYTCHCTGKESFEYLHKRLPNIEYLHCGENIEF